MKKDGIRAASLSLPSCGAGQRFDKGPAGQPHEEDKNR